MTAYEFLKRIEKFNVLIENKINQIEQLRCLVESITAPIKESVSTSGPSDKVGSIVSKIIDLQTEIQNSIDELVKVEKECMQVVDQLDDPKLISVVYKRYFQFKDWTTIAYEMGVTYQWVNELNRRALRKIDEIIYKSF